MLSYAKLWLLLDEKGMQRTDLTKKKIISTATLAKLGKNENVNSSVIERICEFLKCQPGDIMEYISTEDLIKTAETMNEQFGELMRKIQVTTGMSFETMMTEFIKEAPTILEELKKNPNSFDYFGAEELKKISEPNTDK